MGWISSWVLPLHWARLGRPMPSLPSVVALSLSVWEVRAWEVVALSQLFCLLSAQPEVSRSLPQHQRYSAELVPASSALASPQH